MSIRLNHTFPASILPGNDSYTAQITDLTGMVAWWRSADGETLDGSSTLQAWTDRIADAPGYGGVAGKRPLPTAASIGNERGIVFDGVNDFVNMAYPGTRGAAFSWAAVCKMATPAAGAFLCSTFQSSNVGTFFKADANGKIYFVHGSGFTSAPLVAGAPMIIIGGYSNYRISGRVNGVDMARVASDNAAGVQNITLGAANTAANQSAAVTIADFMVFGRDLTTDGAAIALLEGYARDAYGAAIA